MHIGVDIGGTHFSIGLLDNTYNVIRKKYFKIEEDYTPEFNMIKLMAGIKEFMEVTTVKDIGVGLPCPCDGKDEKYNINKPAWKNIDVIERIKRETNLPVYYDNDAKCATIASLTNSYFKDINSGIYITIGTGIGTCIIQDRKVISTEGLGHKVIVENGRQCSCGQKGCFETYASLKALRDDLKEKGYDAQDLKNIFESKDEIVIEIVDKWLDYLASGIVTIATEKNIYKMILGGGVSELYAYYGFQLKQKIEQLMKGSNEYVFIKVTPLLNDAGFVGAAMLGKEKLENE